MQHILDRAIGHHKIGHLSEAKRLYLGVLALEPWRADALHLIGLLAHQGGRDKDAVDLIERAIRIDGPVSVYQINRGAALQGLGRVDEAVGAYSAALCVEPDCALAFYNRSICLQHLGCLSDALASCNVALRVTPDFTEALYNRGNLLRQLGRIHEASDSYRAALCGKPDYEEALCNRGLLNQDLRRLDVALACYETALRIKPDFAEALSNRGNVLFDLGRPGDAIASYSAALCSKPDYAEAFSNRGSVYQALGRFVDALASFDAALHLRPDYAEARFNRGIAFQVLGRLADALASYESVLCLRPDYAEALCNRGKALRDIGRLDEALASYDIALRIKPAYADALSNRLMDLHYRERTASGEVHAAARAYGMAFDRDLRDVTFANRPDPERRLRIGYVSGDFRRHPVGHFLAPVLERHDRSRLEVFCYSTCPRNDDLTVRMQASADYWRSLIGLSDATAAKLIRSDGIDILVDLSGHTAHNRLPVFALKPSPVQLTWLGFWGTTGLTAMDYILSDAEMIPTGEEEWYSERVIRLSPSRFCYEPPEYAPQPVRRGEGLTFGSFNNLAKIGPEVVSLWSRVLMAAPGSRLLLKWISLDDEQMRVRLLRSFEQQGIGSDRLTLRGASPHAEMLGEYEDLDVALDPSPFSGGLTSCEALWMGVPIVTRPGTGAASRQSAGFLRAIGRAEWIAADEEDYVRISADLSADPARLDALRQSLRDEMAMSPLCDSRRFTRNLEQAYRGMWRNWCASRT